MVVVAHEPVVVVLIVMICAAVFASAQCPCNSTPVWDALKVLYESADGPRWHRNDHWLESGSAVCDWFGFQDCNNLTLPNNNLHGTLPAAMVSLAGVLKAFNVTNNSIVGTLPPEFSAWTLIKWFEVSQNKLNGTLPAAYGNWTRISFFRVGDNNFTGSLPTQYSSWTTLAAFNVQGNLLSGSLPPEYSTLVGLGRVDFSRNNLTGTLPPQFSSWTVMDRFDAGGNGLSGTLPPEYDRWLPLLRFDISKNNLSGTLPSQYSSWGAMGTFHVYHNHLTGTLPPQYAAWGTSLRAFTVFGNELNGSLPVEYSAFTSVLTFAASLNRLSGTLPFQYNTWPNFAMVLLDNNDFSGPLPAAWTGKYYAVLTLHDNARVSGTIPNVMSVPLFVSLCTTAVCGRIPTSWAGTSWICQNFSASDVEDYATFTPRVVPASLPPCSTPAPLTNAPTNTIAPLSVASATPAALTASSGLTTAAFGANAISAVAFASIGGASGGASQGSFVQVSSLSARVSVRLRDCGASPPEVSNDDAAVNEEVGSFVGDNPTRLTLPGRLSSSGGTVVGNALLLFAAPPVAAALSYAVRKVVATARGDGSVYRAHILLDLAVRLHLLVYAWVLAPTIAAAAVLLADGGGPTALGVFGLAVAGAPTAVVAVAYVRSRPLKGKVFTAARSQRHTSSTLSEFARRLCADRGSWSLPSPGKATPRGRSKAAPGVVSQLLQHTLSETLHGCVYPHEHVFLFDFAFAAAQGLLAGSALSPAAAPSCAAVRGLLWSIFGLCVCAAVFEAWVRPRATLLDEGITLSMAIWTSLVSLLSALDLEDAATGAAAAQAAVSLCCVVLQMVSSYLRRLAKIGEALRSMPVAMWTTRHQGAPTQPSPQSSVALRCPRRSGDELLEESRALRGGDALKLLLEEICALQSVQQARVSRTVREGM